MLNKSSSSIYAILGEAINIIAEQSIPAGSEEFCPDIYR
jgi:hypothetical protein